MIDLLKEKPRTFEVNNIQIKDFGKIILEKNEMVSFKTNSNKEYDFVAKEWGFYATPSINGRLKKEGFKTALVKNSFKKYYINVVDIDKMDSFLKYLKQENSSIVEWMDERR
ncbi:hypothetical protein M947_11100 [Sulfurimonas hongkongensis]|uniref:Uncharacterized protein n=1 Tax=Sulfurimonas hongkongensis TaxID=1172190 RepID=T0J8U9_9BACT|nr:hypothetical protein [Sulfurimonas hongkongensis]EQB34421.1 hypothetical protein M947_11100 [Sulfurimonas hongkongensis]